MSDEFIDRVYSLSGDEQMRALYDDWAHQYDQDLRNKNYLTPGRVAEALSQFHDDGLTRILDFGCGSGLSGTALNAAGFSEIDGADISEGMLEIARQKAIYKRLWHIESDKPLPFKRGDYPIITAAGAISVGAAPGIAYDQLLEVLVPGGLLVFSMNDKSRNSQEYAGRLQSSLERGEVRILFEQYGPHLDHEGSTAGSTVYVLERLDVSSG